MPISQNYRSYQRAQEKIKKYMMLYGDFLTFDHEFESRDRTQSSSEYNFCKRVYNAREKMSLEDTQIALYLKRHPVDSSMSTGPFVKMTGFSRECVVRFSKKIGYSGFSEMIQALYSDKK
jgi:hypothetical protein